MKLRGMFGALAGALVMAIVSPAVAGLDFVDTATAVGSASTSAVEFNGVDAATFGSIAMPNGFIGPGPDVLTVSAPTNAAPANEVAVIDFSYSNPDRAIDSYANGDGMYDLVIQLGTVTVGATDSILLNSVQFLDRDGGGFSNLYGINATLTGANSNQVLYIDIPELVIPASQRDSVDAVRLSFVFSGSGTSFGINAVANPEPGTIALFGLGLVGLAGVVRRRRRKLTIESEA